MKAYNMKSNNNNDVTNQIVIKNDKEIIFQSYGTTIEKIKKAPFWTLGYMILF